jgi:hypothetical protein
MDEDVAKLKLLVLAVYTRVVNLQFEIPPEIAEKYASGRYAKDIDAIRDFVELLVGEAQDK